MDILVETQGGFAHVRLNRPDDGNRLGQEQVIRLAEVLGTLARDPALKAVVLSGAGEHFCRGREQGGRGGPMPTPLALQATMMAPILDTYHALRAIEVPVVALVQGEAHGFGAALAGSADITIAADTARFSFPELKADMPPTLAMATVMDRVAPKALAWMVYTNTVIDAEEARRVGLVSRVVPAEGLARAGDETLEALLARRREALAGVKRFLARTRLQEFGNAAEYGSQLLAGILTSR